MIRVVFRNLEKSELAIQAVEERLGRTLDRFPDLSSSRITVTLSMENSPLQAGPDEFRVSVLVGSGRYKGIVLRRTAPSLYVALAEVSEHLLERLNRFGDRARVKARSRARKATENKISF